MGSLTGARDISQRDPQEWGSGIRHYRLVRASRPSVSTILRYNWFVEPSTTGLESWSFVLHDLLPTLPTALALGPYILGLATPLSSAEQHKAERILPSLVLSSSDPLKVILKAVGK